MAIPLNRLIIRGIATDLGHEIYAERTILLCMNALEKPNLAQINSYKLDTAHAEVHKELRKEMANKTWELVINQSEASGIQKPTLCDFSVTITYKQETASIVYENES
jgi:hypothetical protein